MARPQRVLPRRRSGVPHILHQQPRRRGDGDHLELPRHHATPPPGDLGAPARRSPPHPALHMPPLPRPLRTRPHASPDAPPAAPPTRTPIPTPPPPTHL